MIYNQEKTYSGIEISGGIGEGGQQRDGIGGGEQYCYCYPVAVIVSVAGVYPAAQIVTCCWGIPSSSNCHYCRCGSSVC